MRRKEDGGPEALVGRLDGRAGHGKSFGCIFRLWVCEPEAKGRS